MSPSRTLVDVDRFTRLTDLPAETAYGLLASTRTRITLHVLSTTEPRVSLERLATAVARLDPETTRSSARISLVHVVLPKLEAHGVIEYELRSGVVHVDGPVVDLDEPIGTVPETTAENDSTAAKDDHTDERTAATDDDTDAISTRDSGT